MSWGDRWDRLTFGSTRRRRALQRLMTRNQALLAGAAEGPGPDAIPAVPSARRRLSALAVVGLGGVLLLTHHGDVRTWLARASGEPATSTDYAFMMEQPEYPGVPVRFSACDPIDVVVNDVYAPPGAKGIVGEAVEEVSELSGLELRLVGRTSETWTENRSLTEGSEFRPVLVAWASPETVGMLSGDVIGLGGPRVVRQSDTGYYFYVTGQISLDTPYLTEELAGGGRQDVKGTVIHELGHVLGLGHVKGDGELMGPRGTPDGHLGPGDRAGFRRMGQGPCLT